MKYLGIGEVINDNPELFFFEPNHLPHHKKALSHPPSPKGEEIKGEPEREPWGWGGYLTILGYGGWGVGGKGTQRFARPLLPYFLLLFFLMNNTKKKKNNERNMIK